MANEVWSERRRGDWELVLPNGGHAGEVPMLLMVQVLVLVLPMVQVLVLVLPIVQVLVLLACR